MRSSRLVRAVSVAAIPLFEDRVRCMADSAFVTGGSGFIGGRLIDRLLSEGWTVRALARSERSASAIRARGAEPVMGDISNVDSIRAGADGCTHAFHAAAHVGDWG